MGVQDIRVGMKVGVSFTGPDNKKTEYIGEVAGWAEPDVFVALGTPIEELSDRRSKDVKCQLRIVVDNVLYSWSDVAVRATKSDETGDYALTIVSNPQVFNRRKYPRMPISNMCTIRVKDTDILCCGTMVNISANGFAFTVKESAFADLKGSEVAVEIDDLAVLDGEYLIGNIIRCSNNEGEYVVGCRMPVDNKAIEEYVSQNYCE